MPHSTPSAPVHGGFGAGIRRDISCRQRRRNRVIRNHITHRYAPATPNSVHTAHRADGANSISRNAANNSKYGIHGAKRSSG